MRTGIRFHIEGEYCRNGTDWIPFETRHIHAKDAVAAYLTATRWPGAKKGSGARVTVEPAEESVGLSP